MIDNPRTLEILKRRCGKAYTPEEEAAIEKAEREKELFYKRLDPILNDLYKLRVILRTRKHTLTKQIQFRKLKKKRDDIIALKLF